jgi:thymidine kinase
LRENEMGKLWVRYSGMGAGKSLQVLAVKTNYVERDMKVALFTAAIDTRYGVGRVTSRLGVSAEAELFDENTVFKRESLASDIACVLVDEAQFLTVDQVRQLHRMANAEPGVPVMCFGLRTDFKGNPFPASALLMCLAEEVDEVRKPCAAAAARPR